MPCGVRGLVRCSTNTALIDDWSLCRCRSIAVILATWLTAGQARSPSHDSAIPPAHSPEASGFAMPQLPRPLAGLERIGNKGSSVCRQGHGALPCRPGGRSLSKERGRQLSPFMSAQTLIVHACLPTSLVDQHDSCQH